MIKDIKIAAVIGSGTMGSSIAAQLLNAGISTILLDLVPSVLLQEEIDKNLTLDDMEVRNRYVNNAIERIKREKPSALTAKKNLKLLTVGNMEDDFIMLENADWIIEAITEDLGQKKILFKKIDSIRKKGSIVSSNTSGISINEIKEGLTEDFQIHFLGTHFFNPPRYIKLLEIIHTKKTNPDVVSFITKFAEEQLGKVVVEAKDTPNFIANRICAYAFLNIVKEMIHYDLSIEEVDQVTGPLIGRPKIATFQTLDMVGLDTFYHVVKNVQGRVTSPEEKEMYEIPTCLEEMLKRNMLGRKVNKGFYTKMDEGLMVLNYHTMKYEPTMKNRPRVERDLRSFLQGNNKISNFLWKGLAPFLLYSATMIGEVADSIYSVDQAVKFGFNWKNGPFRLWDEISLKDTVQRMKKESYTIPEWIEEMIENGFDSFYKEINGITYYYHQGNYVPFPKKAGQISIQEIKNKEGFLLNNGGASLLDTGDGVLLLELHSSNNIIGLDIISMIEQAVKEVEKDNYKGLIIGSEKKNFSVGANLAMMLLEAQNGDELELELVVRRFQEAMKKIKYCKKPVVAAAYQKTLGGGAEICLAASKVQASIETYMGLVETGVGLIPGGGGTKELYINCLKQRMNDTDEELFQLAEEVFQTILTATVSTSAEYARDFGFLDKSDGISFNDLFLLRDAKQSVLDLYNNRYVPPTSSKVLVVGKPGLDRLLKKIHLLKKMDVLSDYDAYLAETLAFVVTGGEVPFRTMVEEDYLLELERKAFIRLLLRKETQQRMLSILQKGRG